MNNGQQTMEKPHPVNRLRHVGRIEGTSFLVLLFIAMPLKYAAGQPLAVKWVGWIHGVLFIWFCWVLWRAWRGGLPLLMAAAAFLASLLPFGPFVIDRTLKHFEPEGSASERSQTLRMLRRVLLFGTVSIPTLLLVVLGLRLLLFKGPYLEPSARGNGRVIDIHCHVAGIGAGDSGCFVSPALRSNFRFDIYLKGFGVSPQELETHGDQLGIQRLAERVEKSAAVDQAVVLAIDGVVDQDGNLDLDLTEFYTPNEFVAREVAKHDTLLFGASVNPHRHDALTRLEWAKANGAVLVKWIPSVMLIDPADESLIPFYEKLKELDLPLLSHGGQEKSFTHARDELADPVRLNLPLDMGVTVIVAHVASTGKNEGLEDFERLLPMFEEYPHLYSEISSLTQANKIGYLRRALSDERLRGRLLYGTDYPLINTALVSPWFFPLNLTYDQMKEISAIENPFDRDVAFKRALGVPDEIFAATATFLNGETLKEPVQ